LSQTLPMINWQRPQRTGDNFIIILCMHFLYESKFSSFSLRRVWLWTNFRTKNACVKCCWNQPLETILQRNLLWKKTSGIKLIHINVYPYFKLVETLQVAIECKLPFIMFKTHNCLTVQVFWPLELIA